MTSMLVSSKRIMMRIEPPFPALVIRCERRGNKIMFDRDKSRALSPSQFLSLLKIIFTCLVAGLNLKILLWLKSGFAVKEIMSVSLSFSSRYTLYLHCTSWLKSQGKFELNSFSFSWTPLVCLCGDILERLLVKLTVPKRCTK